MNYYEHHIGDYDSATAHLSNWMTAALVLLEKFCQQHLGMEFAFEDYRAFALSRGLRRPHVHQVWGSLASMGQRMGLYEPTGEYRTARSIRTHGHLVLVLRVLNVGQRGAE